MTTQNNNIEIQTSSHQNLKTENKKKTPHYLKSILTTSLLMATVLNSTPLLNAHFSSDGNPLYTKPVLADLNILKAVGVPIMYKDNEAQVGYAVINSEIEAQISQLAHAKGRCGNYELLDSVPQDITTIQEKIQSLHLYQKKNTTLSILEPEARIENETIQTQLQNLDENQIRQTVQFLSQFKSRYNKKSNPNEHIQPFVDKLNSFIQSSQTVSATVDLIVHKSTQQKSIKVTIPGSTRPDEIIVMGAHLDSISGWMGTNSQAPGADDNASGSASLLEALRIALQNEQPERTIEFYWYAGEESGLLGSGEIAESAKQQGRDIIAVLQLDLTAFPGDGELQIASMSDFTSSWLRQYLLSINKTYLNAKIVESKCGYGCSDHASWFRRGYPTLFPTESRYETVNDVMHTPKDIISPALSFKHALLFSKIALTMALDLGNSTEREHQY